MQQINSYAINQDRRLTIAMPEESGPFTVTTINGTSYIHAIIDNSKDLENYYFEVYSTNDELTEIDYSFFVNGRRYVGSYNYNGTSYFVLQIRKENQ